MKFWGLEISNLGLRIIDGMIKGFKVILIFLLWLNWV